MYSIRYALKILIKLEFLDGFLENTQIPNLKKNPYSGMQVLPCGRTGRYDDANSHFPQFYESTPKKT